MTQQHHNSTLPATREEQYQALLDWQCLHNWAEAQKAESIIGERWNNMCCPVARYLQAQTGRRWSVGPSIRPADSSPVQRLEKPLWLEDLIREVDAPAAMREDARQSHISKYITREEFLTALSEVHPDNNAVTCDMETETADG